MKIFYWMRHNLFSSWLSSIVTVLIIFLLIKIIPPVVNWTFLQAVWSGEPAVCKAAHGACWAMIHEKYRLILFGYYPYDQQWRPLLGIIIFVALIAVSCIRWFWHKSLFVIWIVGLALWFLIMTGGVFGLSYVSNNHWGGLPLTMMLTIFGIVFAFPFSILLALGRRSSMRFMRIVSVAYIELIRGVPLISILFMASYMLPLFFTTGVTIDELVRAQIAIILFSAAYLAEAIRGGLQAIPIGQYEAANSLGLKYRYVMGVIVLPQALKIAIPSIVSVFIGLFKDTSLVAIVSLTDLLFSLRQAIAEIKWHPYFVEGYIFIALIYLSFCFFMSKYSQYLEREFATDNT